MDALVTYRIERVAQPTQDVLDLITRHVQAMASETPEESCHAMRADDLFASDASLFVLKADEKTLGMGAIKPLQHDHAELKSMHTISQARGRGIGNALLEHMLNAARSMGMSRVSLETGSDDAFAPARRLYERHGFVECPPFGDYVEDPYSVFMTRSL
ncbi:GNAT family N-acetyltransferase [Marivita sp. S0852]|uniref:GNAT family N-acetyltransferase n=1 Tax=Marivita sp. S0852 TaxID=3373893 RepID=UPI003981C8B3